MSAVTPERGRAGLCKDQPVQVVNFQSDNAPLPANSQESIWDLPDNAGDIIAKAISQALDALEGGIA